MQERRLLLAIALSMAVVFAWQILFPPPMPRPRTAVVGVDSGTASSASTADSLTAPSASSSASMSAPTPGLPGASAETTLAATAGGEDTRFLSPSRAPRLETVVRDRYRLEIDEAGGVVRHLALTGYATRHASGESSLTELVSGDTEPVGHLAAVLDRADRAGLGRQLWALETGVRPGYMTFVTTPRVPELPPGLFLEKSFSWLDTYSAELVVTIRNRSGRSLSASAAKLEYPLQGVRREGSLLLHLGPGLGQNRPAPAYAEQYLVTGSFGKAGKREVAVTEHSWTHSIFGIPDPSVGVEWAALENRYFTLAARPDGYAVDANFQADSAGQLHLWLLLPSVDVADGAEKSFRIVLFAGPKSTPILKAFAPELEQLDGMEPTVLPRKISIARMMVGMLSWLEGYLKNWGWAIIVLTILVRVILLPLTHMQFKSMARMQQLKPRIDELQQRYANDKERLQRELLGVYREAGVNPLGGCFPLLVQMPILIGLFIALQNAIELRGVPFIFWIHDLSIPDTVATVVGLPINPLPLFMGATMWVQQKLTPMPSADPAQQQVMMMMPVLMTVLFYSFPSGLSLYWCIQNILSIGQQYYMMRLREVVTK